MARSPYCQPNTSRPTSVTTPWNDVSGNASTVIFAAYLQHLANYRSAAGSLLGVYFLTSYLYVGAIVLLVGIELDELLRKDVQHDEERGILELVRDAL